MKLMYKLYPKMRTFMFLLCAVLVFQQVSITSYATATTTEEYLEEAEERKNDPVESNEVPNWPSGPLIGAESAILMDANTGAILYAKNIDAVLYPASTTKIMTSLVALENCDLTEVITVSQSAIDANAPDGSNMGLVAGEQLTLEELLYGILIKSANEGCNAVAEHICGSTDEFVALMNARAAELGCTNTHFVTTNGLHDENHYTTARDLATIAREFFQHDILCKMSSTPLLILEETDMHGEHYLQSHNRLLEGQAYEYEYLLGSKTGFTSDSRQTLVSCAEYNGLRLICVIMKEESPYQFEDTIALFEYGFSNFSTVNVANNETGYQINHTEFFDSEDDLFGSTAPLLTIDRSAQIVLPNTIDFSQITSSLTYESDSLARIDYTYHSMYLGSAEVVLTLGQSDSFAFSETTMEEDATAELTKEQPIILNIYHILFGIVGAFLGVVALMIAFIRLKGFWTNRQRLSKIKRRHSGITRRREAMRRNASRKPMTLQRNLRTEKENTLPSRRQRNAANRRMENRRREAIAKKRAAASEQRSRSKTGFQRNSSRTLQRRERRNDINFKDFDL